MVSRLLVNDVLITVYHAWVVDHIANTGSRRDAKEWQRIVREVTATQRMLPMKVPVCIRETAN